MARDGKPEQGLDDEDFRALAAVRAELRAFAHFTEAIVKKAGLTPPEEMSESGTNIRRVRRDGCHARRTVRRQRSPAALRLRRL